MSEAGYYKLRCPSCGSQRHGVVDSRPARGSIRRRRECSCGKKFTTFEMSEELFNELSAAQGKVLRLAAIFNEPIDPGTPDMPRAEGG